MTLNDIAGEESEHLRLFLLGRVQAGADPRGLVIGCAAQLGRMAATCTQTGHLEDTLETLINTIRYNALLSAPEQGHA